MALLVAQAGGWGTWVIHRILRQEVYYIRNGKLPAPKQGKHIKVASWLPDEGTIMAIITLAGIACINYARGICHHRGEHISEPKLPE